jgi:hypothetical protein
MIGFCRNAIEAARAHHRPAEHWFGSALHCSINWQCSDAAGRGARIFDSSTAVLGIPVVVVAGLARRTDSHSARNRPALAPAGYRFDLEILITWSLARGTPADRPRDPPTDPRDGSREFSLGRTTHPR